MKIETDIPPPVKANNAQSRWLELVHQMRPGNSVIVENKGQAGALAFVMRYHGKRATVRKRTDGTYRVWRI